MANSRVFIKVLSNFLFSPIPLNGKRRRNRCVLGDKISSKAAFSILLPHNSFEDALLLFSLHPLIVSSSFCLLVAGSGIGVFSKDNVGKSRGDDLGTKTRVDVDRDKNLSTGVDTNGKTGANNLGTGTDVDKGVDGGIRVDEKSIRTNVDVRINDPNTTADDPTMAAKNPSTAANNPGTAANNSRTIIDDPDTGTDIDIETDNPGIVSSNKACTTFFFALYHAFFLLAFSSESMTAFLPSSFLPSSSSTTLLSKLILSYSVTSIKQGVPFSRYPMDEM